MTESELHCVLALSGLSPWEIRKKGSSGRETLVPLMAVQLRREQKTFWQIAKDDYGEWTIIKTDFVFF